MEGIGWQVSGLMFLFLTGLGWGLLYDGCLFFFARRRQAGDFLFWVLSVFLIFPVLLFTTGGELRVSFGISLIVGVACYRWVFHPTIHLYLKLLKRKLRRRRGFF
ncbi:MAG: hypothetical protein GX202_02590 [Firmicutes bacterium]|nr:hypothetical protein [Bacillota bacterium]